MSVSPQSWYIFTFWGNIKWFEAFRPESESWSRFCQKPTVFLAAGAAGGGRDWTTNTNWISVPKLFVWWFQPVTMSRGDSCPGNKTFPPWIWTCSPRQFSPGQCFYDKNSKEMIRRGGFLALCAFINRQAEEWPSMWGSEVVKPIWCAQVGWQAWQNHVKRHCNYLNKPLIKIHIGQRGVLPQSNRVYIFWQLSNWVSTWEHTELTTQCHDKSCYSRPIWIRWWIFTRLGLTGWCIRLIVNWVLSGGYLKMH